MPLFYIAFYQLDVITLRAEIVSLFMSMRSTVLHWAVESLALLTIETTISVPFIVYR